MIIGISGYTGSGKSTLAMHLFENYNLFLINADRIARAIMLQDKTLVEKVDNAFRVVKDGEIDFAKLGEIVFESADNLRKLNEITFQYTIPDIKSTIELVKDRNILLDAPLLPLVEPKSLCDFAIWVECPVETRIERLIIRNEMSREVVKNRIEKQMEIMPAPKADDFWIIIENNSEQNQFFEKAEKVIVERVKSLEKFPFADYRVPQLRL